MAMPTSTPNGSRPQPRPTAPDVPTRVVRADDLAQALARVRLSFGRDALVLGTRTVTIPDPEALRPRTQVEVTVADPDALPRERMAEAGGPATDWARAYAQAERAAESADAAAFEPTVTAPSDDDVSARVDRLNEIATRVRGLASRFDEEEADETSDYPLADALRAQGTTEATLRHLAGSFRLAVRGGDPTVTAARRHLSRFVRGTRAVDVSQIAGEHWFLGRAGSGKTTMLLYLAGALVQAGIRAGVVAVSPPHAGDVQRLRGAERALGVPVHFVDDEAGLRQARSELSAYAALLVDTPCFIGQELPALPPDHAQRHLVVPLGEDRELLRGHLDAARGWQADCLALSQMDLFPRPGRLVDLAVEAGRPISLLQGRQDGGLRVRVARGENLMNAVLGDPTGVRA